MKKLCLLPLACILSLSLLGCEDSTSTKPQPAAGNEPPKYGSAPSGRLGKKGGAASPAVKKELDTKTTVEP